MVFRFPNVRQPLHQFRDDMDRLLIGAFRHWAEDGLPGLSRGQPAVNMWQENDALLVELEVPGLKSDQVDVSVVGDQLTLNIERPELAQEGVKYHRQERPVGSFTRVLRLPVVVDSDRVEAELSDGILTITLPRVESAKPRKIELTTA